MRNPATFAVLLLARQAVPALAARVDEAPDTDAIADRELRDFCADLRDDAGNLMAGHDGVAGLAPLGPDGVDVGVTDAREMDIEGDVVRSDVAAGDRGLGEGFVADVAA